MAEHSTIEWTDATWNPITGCSVVSPGCTNCYAMGLAGTRLKHHPSRAGLTTDSKAGPVWNGKVRLNEAWLTQPLQWKRPRRIFVCAHGDLFAEGVPDEWIDRVFAVMALASQHTFQVLTKRSARMRAYLSSDETAGRLVRALAHGLDGIGTLRIENRDDGLHGFTLPNVWLGVSTEDQRRADERIPDLLATPAAMRFVSAEPLLGPIDFTNLGQEANRFEDKRQDALRGWVYNEDPQDGSAHGITTGYGRLDWIIVGGESGPGARPMQMAWARSIRDQCAAASVAYFHKQNGEWVDAETYPSEIVEDFDVRGLHDQGCIRVGKKAAGRLLDGEEHNAMPPLGRHTECGR